MLHDEFRNYALKHRGISSMKMDRYMSITSDYITPYIIEERPMNITQLDVFSRLMKERVIFLGVPIDDDVANIIQEQLLFLESQDPDRDIQIYINSPGGGVYAGLGIYDTMQYLKPDISTICTGMAASMAAVLLCAGAKGKRFALTHSRVMIHQPMGGTQGQASDIDIEAPEYQKITQALNQLISDHTGNSYAQVWQDCDRDHWMIASEAKEYGLIDQILTKENR